MYMSVLHVYFPPKLEYLQEGSKMCMGTFCLDIEILVIIKIHESCDRLAAYKKHALHKSFWTSSRHQARTFIT